jgi:hypothetical protein
MSKPFLAAAGRCLALGQKGNPFLQPGMAVRLRGNGETLDR